MLDTAKLARRVITRDDAPNCKLSSLARLFRSTTTPNHRALADARATVDVLHGLMERLGGLGVHTLEELQTFSSRVSPTAAPQAPPRRGPAARPRRLPVPRRPRPGPLRRHLPRPAHPGALLLHRLRDPVAGWARWSGSPPSVSGIECATPLEAEVRELRLIAEHKPRYNRRSRFPEKVHFVKLTREPWPRLSLVRQVLDDDADYLGPFRSRSTAEKCLAALHDTFPVRQCSDRLATRSAARPACWPRWAAASRRATAASTRRRTPPWCASCATPCCAGPTRWSRRSTQRMASLAADERFEEAGVHRDRLAAFVRAAARTQRLTALTRCPEVVAARREDDGRWAVHVVRHGRLAAAGVIPPGADAAPIRRRAAASAPRPSRRRPGPVPAATAEETEKVLRWLESPGVRLVDVDGEWTCPVAGATRHLALHDARRQSRQCLVPFADRRALATVHQPAR